MTTRIKRGEPGLHRTPAHTNYRKKKKKLLLLLLLCSRLLLGSSLLCSLLLSSHHSLPPSLICRPDGFHFCDPSGFAAEPQRRGLCDLGGFTKWVAHSRLCGDNQVSQRHTGCLDTGMSRIRQGVGKIFFREVSSEMLRVRHLHDVHGPIEGPSTHRMRALRNCLVRAVHKSHRGQDFTRMVGPTTCRAAQLMRPKTLRS